MDIQRSDIPHIKPILINYLKFATARSEKSRQLEEEVKDIENTEKDIEVLTDEIAAEGKNPEEVEEVIFPGRGIATLEGFENLKKLRHINISFNNVAKLDALEKCLELQSIDASYNKITYIEGLHVLNNLSKLLIHNNKISKLNDIYTLKFNAGLKELSIRGNPLTFSKSHKGELLQLLSGLTVLDGQPIT